MTATKHAERDVDVDVPEVVGGGAADAEREAGHRAAALRGHRDAAPAAEERAGERAARAAEQAIGGPANSRSRRRARRRPGPRSITWSAARMMAGSCSTTTTVLPWSRRRWSRRHQALGVARVQADRRLVEDVERVHERRADGGGQVDALELAARERARLAVERQVARGRPRRGSGAGCGSRRGSSSATAPACPLAGSSSPAKQPPASAIGHARSRRRPCGRRCGSRAPRAAAASPSHTGQTR